MMKQSNRPKTDNLGWIRALILPKKSKPAQTAAAPVRVQAVTAESDPPAWVKTPAPAPVAVPKTAPAPKAQSISQQPSRQPIRLLPAFWTIASVLSFVVNVILIVALIATAQQLFAIKRLVGKDLVGGLYENFILMDQAHIKTNIPVADDVPVNFSLNISQDTTVTLTRPTRINGAQVNLTSGGVAINSPANITLPAGTTLPVHLDLTVPVNTTIPITLNVPVDIPLQQTELHAPFVGLQQVVSPYYWMLQPDIHSASDLPVCKNIALGWWCGLFFR
jgi:hypothetical protein